jgi:hypothetical protein
MLSNLIIIRSSYANDADIVCAVAGGGNTGNKFNAKKHSDSSSIDDIVGLLENKALVIYRDSFIHWGNEGIWRPQMDEVYNKIRKFDDRGCPSNLCVTSEPITQMWSEHMSE